MVVRQDLWVGVGIFWIVLIAVLSIWGLSMVFGQSINSYDDCTKILPKNYCEMLFPLNIQGVSFK